MIRDNLNGEIVYVLGAGASRGDDLPTPPPMLTGFFDGKFIKQVEDAGVHSHHTRPLVAIFSDLIDSLKYRYELSEGFGTDRWCELNLERVFTDLAIEREFFGHDSRQGTESQYLMLRLKQYIRHILGVTCEGPATHSTVLVRSLRECDSILSFNYDLLLDLIILKNKADHYANFHEEILGTPLAGLFQGRDPEHKRICLKLHGSLNWLECLNQKCRMANTIWVAGSGGKEIDFDALTSCTKKIPYGQDSHNCRACRSAMTPLLIPPLLHKQIMDMGVIRSVWGHALNRLVSAEHIVIIGFSFQPTDFYAEWLFRNAASANSTAEIWVVDPQNSKQSFRKRLRSIFRRSCNFKFTKFDQISNILRDLNRI